jgi:putative Ca2+/H+ antiporter (TMEM165/GDT1 family)
MLTGFTASLLLITISELGDKTFFIAAILSLRYAWRLIFVGVSAALVTMTVISVLIGQAVSQLPQEYVDWAEVLLFAIFGLKLLYDATQVSDSKNEEEEEAVEAVQKAEKHTHPQQNALAIFGEAFTLTFFAEWGDRTQIATIALAAAHSPLSVVLGASLGHMICALIAVKGGKMVARHLSEKMLMIIGGCLFLIFSGMALWENLMVSG